MRNDISIGPITQALRNVALDEGWFESHEENWIMGYGRGDIGSVRAIERFKLNQDRNVEEESFGMLGVYDHAQGRPVGYLTLEYLGEDYKTVDLFMYIAPEYRREGIGYTSLSLALKEIFKKKIHRVQVHLLSINKDAVSFFRRAGFTQEGVKREAYWMGINSFNVVILRLLRPEWKKE